MAKYRIKTVVEVETDKNLPEINFIGSMDDMEDLTVNLPDIDDFDEDHTKIEFSVKKVED